MSHEQIGAWYVEELKQWAAGVQAEAELAKRAEGEKRGEANYANCMREVEWANAENEWLGPPSALDCIGLADPALAKALALLGEKMIDEDIRKRM